LAGKQLNLERSEFAEKKKKKKKLLKWNEKANGAKRRRENGAEALNVVGMFCRKGATILQLSPSNWKEQTNKLTR